MKIELLDCTLRDGAYITNGMFGKNVIKGIISNLDKAGIDLIEIGWLKNDTYKEGSTYYNRVEDTAEFINKNSNEHKQYSAMIDFGRYDLSNLSQYDGSSIDTIRLVLPKEKYAEAIEFSKKIKEKGYSLCLQAANTPSYSDKQLIDMIEKINEVMPNSISIVDTFGTMYESDLSHIFRIINNNLDKRIKIGFHSHNNLQLSFALSISFIKFAHEINRNIIIDSSLCGMGRGAGNTCTELITNYINEKNNGNYDTNLIMDTIDIYMQNFIKNYKWGYSIPLCLAGQLGSHVNNIAYLQNSHKTNCRDIKVILETLPREQRKLYDYDILEEAYIDYLNKEIDDKIVLNELYEKFTDTDILFIAPGKSIQEQKSKIFDFIKIKHPVIIGINSVSPDYDYDYLFFSNNFRYQYAKEQYPEIITNTNIILTSNIQTKTERANISIINFNTLMKRGWKYFDNSTIIALRLFSKLNVKSINFAGFDGYSFDKKITYNDILLQNNLPIDERNELNNDIKSMLEDFIVKDNFNTNINFVTDSQFSEILDYGKSFIVNK